ncbi:MAG: accessory factor UbiK family protein [Emcibacter sp.]|nr:accessory factor UbiK family protein [Emcibacter sp.]
MQTDNKFFDDLAKLGQSAAGTLHGVKGEFEAMFRARLDYILKDMDLVTREEFEVVRDMAKEARAENELLVRRITEIEKQLTAKAKTRKDTKK